MSLVSSPFTSPSPPPPQAMTEAERAPYAHRAKVEKKGMSGVVREGRMDNQGELLSVSCTAHSTTHLTVKAPLPYDKLS